MTSLFCTSLSFLKTCTESVYEIQNVDARIEVFTAVLMQIKVFWDMTPCGLVRSYWRFLGAYCLHLFSTWTSRHYVVLQKTSIFKNIYLIKAQLLLKIRIQVADIHSYVTKYLWLKVKVKIR